MSERRSPLNREDVLLLVWSTVLGLAGAAGFAAFRALSASDEDAGGRFAEFGANLLWPGVLIFFGVAVVVWLGWKANLD